MELPRLEPLHKKYKDRGLEVVAIEAFQMTELAEEFIEENQLTYHFVQDKKEKSYSGSLFQVNGYPTTFVIDRKGRVLYFHLGFEEGDEKQLEEEIQSLI